MDRDKDEKFVQLATKRVNRAIKDIRLIGNLANRRNYSYTDDQAKKIIAALQKELSNLKGLRPLHNTPFGEVYKKLSNKIKGEISMF